MTEPGMFTLYARREPSTDDVLARYAPKARKTDVVLYTDAACTEPKARFRWDYAPTRRKRTIIFNCWRWRLEWVDQPLQKRPPALPHQ
jgi:hypothetical protein